MALTPDQVEPAKCAWHPRRAADHELLGLRFCSTCARIGLRAIVNQADDERVTVSPREPVELEPPAQGQLAAGPTPEQPL